VHTSEELTGESFDITVDGRAATLDAVFPGFSERDRVGVVVRRPLGAAGASLLVLAAVTGFYDEQRRRAEPFFVYPDYFVFHAGRPLGDHRKLDIWPPHKEVVVEDEPEALLRAINDRAVTRLVVEDGDGAPTAPELAPETLASARRRIATCLAYAPGGRTAGGGVAIAGNEATERFVAAMVEQSDGARAEAPAATEEARRALVEHGRPVETYRAITLAEALARLG
jgi:hypothetical protein